METSMDLFMLCGFFFKLLMNKKATGKKQGSGMSLLPFTIFVAEKWLLFWLWI